MSEETLFKAEQTMSSKEIADYLRDIADKFESGSMITLRSGSQEVELDPQGRKWFEVEAERETGSVEEISLELEIEWKAEEGKELQID